MKRITWKQIIESDLENIQLIGYGSLLNSRSHHDKHLMTPVIFHGFKRIYNLPVFAADVTKCEMDFMKKYLKKYNITTQEEIDNFISNSPCVLNCEYTGNDENKVNGLCLNVNKKDFVNYSMRECCYDLILTNYHIICPQTGKVTPSKKKGYVLVGHNDKTAQSGEIFEAYHQSTRTGAYEIGEYFGKFFDQTTYHFNELVIEKL